MFQASIVSSYMHLEDCGTCREHMKNDMVTHLKIGAKKMSINPVCDKDKN